MKLLRLLLLVMCVCASAAAQTSALVPSAKAYFSDVNGHPLAGGLVYFYAAGTTSPLATYSDSLLTVPNSNPVVLDTSGKATIYLQPASYKVVVQTSASAAVYTQDNVFDLAQLLTVNLANSGAGYGGNLVGYLAPGSGAVSTTVERELDNTIWVESYGAACDGVTDDGAKILNAIAYAASIGPSSNKGGHVRYHGYCASSKSIDLPANVTLEGDNPNSGGIVILSGGTLSKYATSSCASGCPNYTYGFSVGGTATTPVEGARFLHMSMICQNNVQTCFQTSSAEENSGLTDVLISGSLNYGVDVVGYGTQNSDYQGLTIFAGQNAVAGWQGAHFYECNSRCSIKDVTINGALVTGNSGGTVLTNSGLKFEAGTHGSITNIHCEEIAVCVELQDSFAPVDSIALNNGNPPNMIAVLNHGMSALNARNIQKYGPAFATQITICDQTITGTSTCGFAGSTVANVAMPNDIIETAYASAWNAAGGTNARTVVSTSSSGLNFIASVRTLGISFPGFGAISTSTRAELLFTQATGLSSGFRFQNGLITPGAGTGGLHLNAGGYFGHPDGSDGSACVGANYDSGTLNAELANFGCVSWRDGNLEFISSAGVTLPYSSSNPNKPLIVTPNGIRLTVSATNPGCNMGNQGIVWVNSAASPPRWEYCDGANFYYSAPVLGP